MSESVTLAALHAANKARQTEWCEGGAPEPDLAFRGNELAGETGEACNVIKKLERERHGWRGSRATPEQLAEELADVVICADLCAVTAGIDLGAAVVAKFNATSEKVGLTTRLSPAVPASPIKGGGTPTWPASYQETFDAIAAAVTVHDGTTFGISVKAFYRALAHPEPASPPAPAEHGAEIREAVEAAFREGWRANLPSDTADDPATLAFIADLEQEAWDASQAKSLSQGGGAGRSERAVEIRELSKLADDFEQSGKTLIHPEQFPPGYVKAWEEAHRYCARDLRTLAASLAGRSEKGEGEWSAFSAVEIVRRTRCMADETRDPVVWRDCCDLILERLGALTPAPAQSPSTSEQEG